jgi:hypothetical protein
MVSGLALLIITVVATFKFTKRNLNQELIFSLSRLLRIIIVILAVMVLIDKLTHLYSPHRDPRFGYSRDLILGSSGDYRLALPIFCL